MSYLGHDAVSYYFFPAIPIYLFLRKYLAPAMYAMHPAMMGSQSLEGRSL